MFLSIFNIAGTSLKEQAASENKPPSFQLPSVLFCNMTKLVAVTTIDLCKWAKIVQCTLVLEWVVMPHMIQRAFLWRAG